MVADQVPVQIGLNAVIVEISQKTPNFLALSNKLEDKNTRKSLPYGAFDPLQFSTFEASLRASVKQQTDLAMGYVEQLYTFGDRGRHFSDEVDNKHVVSVGYLALTLPDPTTSKKIAQLGANWTNWYALFPWEDWRQTHKNIHSHSGRPTIIDDVILPLLLDWGKQPNKHKGTKQNKMLRIKLAFGLDGFPWDEERVLERYELLYEAGLVEEAHADGRIEQYDVKPPLGQAMQHDHRRIVATAIARLRAKIKYRPVVFELMPPEFTLTELQETVEAISGKHLHKQNFRRLVDGAELVENSGNKAIATGGRPAALYKFRNKILEERPAPGLKLGR